jgi:hypothetical protein
MVKEAVNPKKGITDRQAQEFIRNHFEELVNRKNVTIARVDFAPNFVDHGADLPPGLPPTRAGRGNISRWERR